MHYNYKTIYDQVLHIQFYDFDGTYITIPVGKLYVCKLVIRETKHGNINEAGLLAYSQGKLWFTECM